ncbi:50S ribosomal protein L10 [Methylomonas sp. EFPC1]|nr:50S ribosomal protein L10 [Methylomonas sp. EFPC1]
MDIETKKSFKLSLIEEEVAGFAAKAHSAVAAEYRGLTVTELTQLRRTARETGVYLRVVKNTLAKRAVAGTEFESMQDGLVGPLILAFSMEDPGSAARLIREFSKGHNKLIAKVIAIGGQAFDGLELDRLARLPTRDDGINMLISVLKAPLGKLISTLHAVKVRKKEQYELSVSEAEARGLLIMQQLLRSSEMMPFAEAVKFLDIDPTQLYQKCMRKEFLWLSTTSPADLDNLFLPKWQFHSSILPRLPELLCVLDILDNWAIWVFFKSPSPILRELSPLEVLGIENSNPTDSSTSFINHDYTSSDDENINLIFLAARDLLWEYD